MAKRRRTKSKALGFLPSKHAGEAARHSTSAKFAAADAMVALNEKGNCATAFAKSIDAVSKLAMASAHVDSMEEKQLPLEYSLARNEVSSALKHVRVRCLIDRSK